MTDPAAASTPITYPPDLPITERRRELLDTIGANQVVIVAGETGSGKSTQLPKLCLELGHGNGGLIGHTQPRRIAARSIAERVADELGTEVGLAVGYTVRFNDQVGEQTKIKLMTDGILLAEITRDRALSAYNTIIIDEAHERSLNIDFLLGCLHQLLPRRPDLKLIITSATIDTDRFSAHFDDAPIVEVSGRTYPVEIRYRPLDDPDTRPDEPLDQPQAICEAVEELVTEADGDVLVFCSGEREIRDAVDALRELSLPGTEIIPLYARLSAAEQHRVFQPHRGRRVVVATNVAETSLTVPGVRFVVDPGTARVSRYSRRTKVQRLPIEPVSQASADQRAGRCGRLGPGICIRLYDEDDYATRPEFTDPEIQRTSLASVILQMTALGLGDVESFPFVDPPETAAIRDGIALLEELGALKAAPRRRSGAGEDQRSLRLTASGRKLAKLPVDPRLARMLLAADTNGCLREMLIITAGLSIQDPRDRPKEKRQEADGFHARFHVEGSDFLSYLELWNHLRSERQAGSSGRFRRMCRREFLNYPRVREWQDVHAQLRQVCDQLGMRRNRSPASPDVVHRSLLPGLLSHVGMKERDTFEYRGARGARFAISPGSSMFKNGPRWVMAAELTETNRLWANVVTGTRPELIEAEAGHLVKRSYTDPTWDPERGAAVARESVSLYGLPLVGGRTVLWGRINPADARDLFIHHALVWGEWEATHDFIDRNSQRVEEVRALEARQRRSDLLIGDEQLVDWFAARLPDQIVSAGHFNRWWKKARADTPDLLDLTVADLIRHEPDNLREQDQFPESLLLGDLEFPLEYEFDPTSPDDGITVDIPVSALSRLREDAFDWLVPGLRSELVTALIRSLPKTTRKTFVPIPETVEQILPLLDPSDGALLESLRRELSRIGQIVLAPDAFDVASLPLHLRPNFRVLADDGTPLARGGDLTALKALVQDEVRASLSSSRHELERSGLVAWTVGDLAHTVETEGAGHRVQAYPALIDEGDTVGVRLLATAAEQQRAMWTGTRRLLLLNRPGVSKPLRGLLTNEVKLALVQSPYESPTEWFDDLLGCAVDELMIEADAPVWNTADWDRLLTFVRDQLPVRVVALGATSADLLRRVHNVRRALSELTAEKFQPAVNDMDTQLAGLIYPGFLTGVGARNLASVGRYVDAIARRIERLPENPRRDTEAMLRILALDREHDQLVESLPGSPDLDDIVWQIQELRVSLFAQSLGTGRPVSEKRIRAAMARLRKAG